jgi:hypothetical protein
MSHFWAETVSRKFNNQNEVSRMALFKKHKNKLITVGLTIGVIAALKFTSRQFPNVPLIGSVAKFL